MLRTEQSNKVQLARDSLGFVRRACPQCARHFKVGASHAEDMIVQATFAVALRHANPEEIAGLPRRFCPYCAHSANADAFLTGAQRAYIEAWARSVASELRYEQLRQVETRLSANPYVTFMALPPVEPAPELPPEPDDMQRAPLRCCGEELKIKSSWRDPFFCHHCRARQHGER